mmetsp:Transcript_70073/g.160657  ORF Transcript_70073/g.160657 Transcript_70073/m.160657 type:complete len:258 (+) Transcript_70073:507-1280(+)
MLFMTCTSTEDPRKRMVPEFLKPFDTNARRSLTALGPKSGMSCIGGKITAAHSSSQRAFRISASEESSMYFTSSTSMPPARMKVRSSLAPELVSRPRYTYTLPAGGSSLTSISGTSSGSSSSSSSSSSPASPSLVAPAAFLYLAISACLNRLLALFPGRGAAGDALPPSMRRATFSDLNMLPTICFPVRNLACGALGAEARGACPTFFPALAAARTRLAALSSAAAHAMARAALAAGAAGSCISCCLAAAPALRAKR